MRVGNYKIHHGSETYKSYIPVKLPIDVQVDLNLMEKAASVLSELGNLSVPNLNLFLYMYVRKEAVLSSQIEGTQSSLNDLILFENNADPNVPMSDVTEVSRYVAALEHGITRLKEGFPLCLRLIREMHEILLHNSRGKDCLPGEFRTSQNWVGGTRPGNAAFVPPEPEILDTYLGNLEQYIHSENVPVLLRAAIAHVQFETIHPFLDGNGRIGRLLIILILYNAGILKTPLLYISLFFKENRYQYYELLNDVRKNGSWEDWISFFMQGIIVVSEQAISIIHETNAFFANCDEKIALIGRQRFSVQQVFEYLKSKPITSATATAKYLGISVPTARTALQKLVDLKIIEANNIDKKSCIYKFQKYLQLLERI